MGFEEVAAFSNSHPPQNIQDSVERWLSPVSREEPGRFYNFSRHSQERWALNTYNFKPDVDQTSIASIDDDVSVSDSAHESYSSESSSQTSWTSTTDPGDIFLDEDGREPLPPLKKVLSHTALEPQEQLLKGLQNKDHIASDSSCPLGYAYRSLKARVSTHLQQPSQTCLRLRGGDASFDPDAQHWSARRTACSFRRQCPPRLKRDTDVTEQFVSLLIVFAKRLITAIWPLSDRPPMMSDCFNGAGVLRLDTFIKETLRRSKTSYSTLQVALYYLILLKSRMCQGPSKTGWRGESSERSQCRAMQCGRRMFLSALMLASKYLQDRNYSARAWSKISGLRSNEINENEREYLAQINYDLHVPKEAFDNWSKIVLILSKLSSEGPACRPSTLNENFGPPGGRPGASLAAMISQVGLEENMNEYVFSDSWWTALLRKLEPSTIKDTAHVDEFLRTNLPSDKMEIIASLAQLSKQVNRRPESSTPGTDAGTHGYDLNFSEALKTRIPESTKTQPVQAFQTLVQMSPAKGLALPTRPHLGNLPTPQTTPRPDHCAWERTCSRSSLRCSASLDALRSMRKQCLMNANLERCPPPRPQSLVLPSVKCLLRPAETIQELPSRSTTPVTSSPASISSDSTTLTSRSRSSSISSNSSWSSWAPSIPQLRRRVWNGVSSPLSRVSSLSDRHCKPVSTDCQRSEIPFHRESCPEESRVQEPKNIPTSSEVAAIHGLMSLSALTESPSQSVTPTPQRLAEKGDGGVQQRDSHPRGQKRTLSKIDSDLHAQVRSLLSQSQTHMEVVEDSLPLYSCLTPTQLQQPTKLLMEPRRAVSNAAGTKRHCSMHHSSSTPDMSLRFLTEAVAAS
ncbi:uncharacterized protein Z519_02424 [Cladophialophora bantiana CBS 173.52]|uniref:Cyclin N-terminal domain-containing protein n=1 Tax=Cladophialophora bantiana (strain ATCC 10958 / CBS 173.52 / CDC B-1940 / NIH 8579) TaxID=1442370 RepID=A0A0D2GFB6_CLAB1|nr:uncharacterized protein Z519_02424 [Cladophialophora bantiana CBS 173.52]KIW97032.1 hypothetical protein Z519_02424 [Cladophialophora bantiana CBS 173.52]